MSPHPQGLVLLGTTANHSTQGLTAPALCSVPKGVFHQKSKKELLLPSSRTSFLPGLTCSREMPPPSERQKAAGYQNEGWIKQKLWGAKQQKKWYRKLKNCWSHSYSYWRCRESICKIWAPVNTLSRFTGQRDNNQTFLLLLSLKDRPISLLLF